MLSGIFRGFYSNVAEEIIANLLLLKLQRARESLCVFAKQVRCSYLRDVVLNTSQELIGTPGVFMDRLLFIFAAAKRYI
ncbi:hypothetical protein DXT99_08650 [Pontibacter diazotrophicus]|uniref:Uncharacterized protein n=1 Tax=Pontibacter diazotrophicus TaxID=1400979 RepID=A0A3D8LDR2_9BACT|nr:hypothetical protein DXT99_08650 [Pontibacter diazotrophicus]